MTKSLNSLGLALKGQTTLTVETTGMSRQRVALITGASKGIGKAIAIELARCGATAVVNYLDDKCAADDVVRAIKNDGHSADAIQADVSSYDDVTRMVDYVGERFGHIDILVNNAGVVRDRSFRKMTNDEWEHVLSVNLNGTRNCCAAVVSGMMDRSFGRIVNIASVIGQSGNFGQTNYAASKAAIIGFTKSLALECARSNVTVNAVCPGFVETDMWSALPDERKDQILGRIPMRRVAMASEVAAAVRFLVNEGAYITGHSLNVNGGLYLS